MFFRNLKWDIVGQRNVWFGLSAIVIIAGAIALFVHHGLPLGLSFTGGSTVEVKLNKTINESEARAALSQINVSTVDTGDPDQAKQAEIRKQFLRRGLLGVAKPRQHEVHQLSPWFTRIAREGRTGQSSP